MSPFSPNPNTCPINLQNRLGTTPRRKELTQIWSVGQKIALLNNITAVVIAMDREQVEIGLTNYVSSDTQKNKFPEFLKRGYYRYHQDWGLLYVSHFRNGERIPISQHIELQVKNSLTCESVEVLIAFYEQS